MHILLVIKLLTNLCDQGRKQELRDRKKSQKLYLQVKGEVENCIAYLKEKRQNDPYRNILPRLIYQATHGFRAQVPTFELWFFYKFKSCLLSVFIKKFWRCPLMKKNGIIVLHLSEMQCCHFFSVWNFHLKGLKLRAKWKNCLYFYILLILSFKHDGFGCICICYSLKNMIHSW